MTSHDLDLQCVPIVMIAIAGSMSPSNSVCSTSLGTLGNRFGSVFLLTRVFQSRPIVLRGLRIPERYVVSLVVFLIATWSHLHYS